MFKIIFSVNLRCVNCAKIYFERVNSMNDECCAAMQLVVAKKRKSVLFPVGKDL